MATKKNQYSYSTKMPAEQYVETMPEGDQGASYSASVSVGNGTTESETASTAETMPVATESAARQKHAPKLSFTERVKNKWHEHQKEKQERKDIIYQTDQEMKPKMQEARKEAIRQAEITKQEKAIAAIQKREQERASQPSGAGAAFGKFQAGIGKFRGTMKGFSDKLGGPNKFAMLAGQSPAGRQESSGDKFRNKLASFTGAGQSNISAQKLSMFVNSNKATTNPAEKLARLNAGVAAARQQQGPNMAKMAMLIKTTSRVPKAKVRVPSGSPISNEDKMRRLLNLPPVVKPKIKK